MHTNDLGFGNEIIYSSLHNKLIEALNCIVKFSHSSCDRTYILGRQLTMLERLMDSIILKGMLLVVDKLRQQQTQATSRIDISLSNDNQIMLLHNRLSHPSFSYLKLLFLALFKNENSSMFQCEIFQLSKCYRFFFPTQSYKESKPFSLRMVIYEVPRVYY